jgi:ATP adenylyltransferase/5',5'''-P-1,P-4-tetraphosphate phosphorylase II
MRLVIEEMNGIGFYNAGEMSGARYGCVVFRCLRANLLPSQPHKHMQVIPLGTDEKLPVDDIIEKSKAPKDTVHVIPDLPYVNRCCVFSDFSAKYLREVYEKVMHEVFEDLRKVSSKA